MNNNENAGGLLCTDEERLLISRATELSRRDENSAVALSFLTLREQRLVYDALKMSGAVHRLFFWGGYFGAERRKALFLPEWLITEPCSYPLFSEEREKYFVSLLSDMGMLSLADEYLNCVKIRTSGYVKLSHRDFLGSLMGLGFKRSVIGDICMVDDGALVFCEPTAADYVACELRKAGRETVKCEKIFAEPDFRPVRSFTDIRTTVASPRLDGVVRGLCNLSRDDALSLVEGGAVEINYYTEKKPDRTVLAGDVISVKGQGKYIVDSADTKTVRGRLRLIARKYT